MYQILVLVTFSETGNLFIFFLGFFSMFKDATIPKIIVHIVLAI